MSLESPGETSTDLRERVDATKAREQLPLVHVTEMGIGRNIVFSGQLQARPCKVFDRNLLYFFLGRPAYRLRQEEEGTRYISRYPCVFVVDPSRVAPVQVYPFDTGAAKHGYYEDADPHLGIKDYALEGTYDSALRQLAFAFDSVEDYFAGRTRHDLIDDVPEFHQSTRSYASIANQANRGVNTPGTYDDRASAIEIATDRHLDLKGAVQLAIMPKQFLEGGSDNPNTKLLDRLKELDIECDLYDWQSTRTPADFRAEINGKVLAHVKRAATP
jgi:hypothetical protein